MEPCAGQAWQPEGSLELAAPEQLERLWDGEGREVRPWPSISEGVEVAEGAEAGGAEGSEGAQGAEGTEGTGGAQMTSDTNAGEGGEECAPIDEEVEGLLSIVDGICDPEIS